MRITNRHARRLLECSERTAARRISLAKDALGKRPYQVLTVEEFCAYYDVK